MNLDKSVQKYMVFFLFTRHSILIFCEKIIDSIPSLTLL